MATQLALDGIQPRRFVRHTVMRPKVEEESLSLVFGTKPPSIFSIPWPMNEEPAARPCVAHNSHACGLARHFWACANGRRCTLPFKAPCTTCEQRVQASYAAGRYAVAR